MTFLIENWFIGVAIIAILAVTGFALYMFIKKPTNEQLEKVKQWLLYAVISAEKELGSKTGRVKLSLVYGNFVAHFKWLSMIVSFEMFSELVGEALEEMRKMLETNQAVKNLVKNEDKNIELK